MTLTIVSEADFFDEPLEYLEAVKDGRHVAIGDCDENLLGYERDAVFSIPKGEDSIPVAVYAVVVSYRDYLILLAAKGKQDVAENQACDLPGK